MFRHPRDDVVVLVQDHYSESLTLLDHVFGTDHFSSSSQYRHNTARESQDRGVVLGSAEEITAVSRMLEMHQALYHLCLEYFLRYFGEIQASSHAKLILK